MILPFGVAMALLRLAVRIDTGPALSTAHGRRFDIGGRGCERQAHPLPEGDSRDPVAPVVTAIAPARC
jgi:hypothetical protein